jgi:hypothetical protein
VRFVFRTSDIRTVVVVASRVTREVTHDHIDRDGGVGDARDLQADA